MSENRQQEVVRRAESDIPHGIMWQKEEVEDEASKIVGFLMERIQPVLRYIQNKYGVSAPAFIFQTVDHATSWRRKLTNNIVFLQKALRVIPRRDSMFFEVKELEGRFQKHINVANAVLHQYYDADETYKGIDLRDDIDEFVFKDVDLFGVQQDLLRSHEELRERVYLSYEEELRRS